MKARVQYQLSAYHFQVSSAKLKALMEKYSLCNKKRNVGQTQVRLWNLSPQLSMNFCRSQVDPLYCQIQGKDNDHNEQHQQSDNHRRHPIGNRDDVQLLMRYLGIRQLGSL